MKTTWLLIIAGALFLANSVESGASLVRSMSLRGSQQDIPEDNNHLRGQQSQSRSSYQDTAVYNGGRNGRNNKDALPAKAKKDRGLGISAWGIIGIIMGTILLTTIGYYSFVLYPLICKKKQSYDVIELTNVV